MEWVMFSKHLDLLGLSLEEVARDMKEMGFDGMDLTVRPGGRIEPHEVEHKLPDAVATIEQMGLSVPMITTGITSIHSPYAEAIFGTAAECGIPALKLGYWRLQDPAEFWTMYENATVWLDGIQSLAMQYGVSANIHMHSGPYISAYPPVVYMLLEGRDPRYVGAYVDSGHMVIEGGRDGWRQGLVMLGPYINLVALKGYSWVCERDENGKLTYDLQMLGFEESQQDWSQFLQIIKSFGYDGTVSLHSEYGEMNHEQLIDQTQRDLDYIKEVAAALEQ